MSLSQIGNHRMVESLISFAQGFEVTRRCKWGVIFALLWL